MPEDCKLALVLERKMKLGASGVIIPAHLILLIPNFTVPEMSEDRRLAAIMFTDIVGYTALMGSDEDKAFNMLKRNYAIHEILIKKFNGTLITDPVNDLMIAYPQARLQKGIPAGSTTPLSFTR